MTKENNMTKKKRSIVKTMSYSAMHMVVAISVAYALSGSWIVALSIGLIEPMVQTVAYTFHERLWERVPALSK